MAEITVPIKLDLSVVVLEVLKKIESDREDYMYNQGFYDCRDRLISAVENFIDQCESGDTKC